MKRGPGLVMIADADPNVRELVGHFVTEAGYRVSYAMDGYEALDSARRLPPDVILADVLLPRLDGLALCRLLKADKATQKIVTVIVFSVLPAEERAVDSGADGFIQKPLEKSRVLKVIEAATGDRRISHE